MSPDSADDSLSDDPLIGSQATGSQATNSPSMGEQRQFMREGFLALRGAFSRALAAECVEVLWRLTGLDPRDRAGWTEPVLRVPGAGGPAFVSAINGPRLTAAIDALVGPGRWQPRTGGYGTFPIRFPSPLDPGDTGWHVDGGFGDPPWYRVNLASRGRALLLLMLFSDVGEHDAPTRARAGSHEDVARALAQVGPEGCALDVARQAPAALERPVVSLTGAAGDVFLCHPFLVHAASWPHRGERPRFLGQPAIHHPEGEWAGGFRYDAPGPPVVEAVRRALRP